MIATSLNFTKMAAGISYSEQSENDLIASFAYVERSVFNLSNTPMILPCILILRNFLLVDTVAGWGSEVSGMLSQGLGFRSLVGCGFKYNLSLTTML